MDEEVTIEVIDGILTLDSTGQRNAYQGVTVY